MRNIDATHDANLHSWVESAGEPETDFPIQNLPLGMFSSEDRVNRPGIAIGTDILDLVTCCEEELIGGDTAGLVYAAARVSALNPLLAAGAASLASLRKVVSDLLSSGTDLGARASRKGRTLLVQQRAAELHLPARIGDYTDFYASINHATNVGSMFRPDNPLLPNYKWVPIGYHGRASSIVASGTNVFRPSGQTRDDSLPAPEFGPTKRLDYELEVGAFISQGNSTGHPIRIADAEYHIAGLCLVNDWSARDVQAWEYQPLGPFLAKNFTTTVSAWIVTLDALAPFRAPAFARDESDPQPLPYLAHEDDAARGGIDITLEVLISTSRMREQSLSPVRLSIGSFTSMYWTLAQLVTHHASNGCNLQPGDLIASGTVSGAEPESRGSMLERAWRGSQPFALPSGETRKFLEDGDEIIMRGWCERDGFRRIGFGECRGLVTSAPSRGSHPAGRAPDPSSTPSP